MTTIRIINFFGERECESRHDIPTGVFDVIFYLAIPVIFLILYAADLPLVASSKLIILGAFSSIFSLILVGIAVVILTDYSKSSKNCETYTIADLRYYVTTSFSIVVICYSLQRLLN